MSDRTYRLLLGASILFALYFSLPYMMYVIIAIPLLEGITNWRIPLLVQKMRGAAAPADVVTDSLAPFKSQARFDVEAERVWRIVVSVMLFITYVILFSTLWVLPWFLGFAIIGAGVSGVCPGLIAMKSIGCK